MTKDKAKAIKCQPRFEGIFEDAGQLNRKLLLTSGFDIRKSGELLRESLEKYSEDSFIMRLEKEISSYIGVKEAVATNSGMSAMHLAVKLATKNTYGTDDLEGKRVFCSNLCHISQAMPILYEKGTPVFIDVDDISYGIDPESLSKAFEIYPDVRIVIAGHLYGYPARIEEIRDICHEHDAILIENASEGFGAGIYSKKCGSFGDMAVLDFGKDKIVSSEGGGMLLLNDTAKAQQVRQWLDISDKKLPWGHYDEVSYDYRISESSAAVILAQLKDIDELIERKKEIYTIYRESLNEELLYMIEADEGSEPNYWMMPVMIDGSLEPQEVRKKNGYSYEDIHGTTSPMEIVDVLEAFGAEAAPFYMPMSMQPVFKSCELIGAYGVVEKCSAYETDDRMFIEDNSTGACRYGVCLPAMDDMTSREQSVVVEVVHRCFDASGMAVSPLFDSSKR